MTKTKTPTSLIPLLYKTIIGGWLMLISAISSAETLVIVGDSISAGYGINPQNGWVSLLSEKLQLEESGYQTINASVSGNTTGDGLSRLPKLLETYSPEIVVIELGGNDGLRGYPLKLMETNLTKMIQQSRDAGAKVLLLGIEIPPNYGQRYTDEFRNVYQRVAENENVILVPFILENIATQPDLMQNDGIHPTEEAQGLLLENILPALKSIIVID
ncbi:arylesterase [Sessilibacter sp. MAH4]